MGKRAADVVKAIEDTRERLGYDLSVLEQRLPDADDAKQAAAVAVAGFGALLVAGIWAKRRRDRRLAREELQRLINEATETRAEVQVGGAPVKFLAAVAAGTAAGIAFARARSTAAARQRLDDVTWSSSE